MNGSISLLIACLIAGPLGAQAASVLSASVRAAFGNTVMIVDPDGRSRKIWLQPDGTWTGLSRRGLGLAGGWTMKGEKVCLTQTKPQLFGGVCHTFPTDLATGVTARDPMGKTIRLKLVAGHVER